MFVGQSTGVPHVCSLILQVQSSSLAVTIANVSCPTSGNAQVAAIAIATVAQTDRSIASAAIAGVLTSGVDITATFEQVAALAAPQHRYFTHALCCWACR